METSLNLKVNFKVSNMVVSLLDVTNDDIIQPKESISESPTHKIQISQAISPTHDQQNCNTHIFSHDQTISSAIQNAEQGDQFGFQTHNDNSTPVNQLHRTYGLSSLQLNQSQSTFADSTKSGQISFTSSSSSFDDDPDQADGTSLKTQFKVRKCRTCGFSSTDKCEFWKHVETHLDPEKILRCPECPFVTSYKHHLDFHTQNHQGNKPYKCDQCPYECVNKSMLKSHLKSHSNIYQYGCQDCPYKTKYYHSLKIHLKKYQHRPGQVLDADGKPNMNAFIDVHGNRRGPKSKIQKSKENEGHSPHSNTLRDTPRSIFSPDNSQFCIRDLSHVAGSTFIMNSCAESDLDLQTLFPDIPNSPHLLENDIKKERSSSEDDKLTTPRFLSSSPSSSTSTSNGTNNSQSFEETPLNLSASQSNPTPRKIRRRKGVAKRYAQVDDSKLRMDRNEAVNGMETDADDEKQSFHCDHCKIIFYDHVMFTLHMGYHRYNDPFTCNKCGEKTQDKISFYLHMITVAHN